MISELKTAGEQVGITTVVTNSTEKIETQLNRITAEDQLPIMLISWDLETTLDFDTNGFLKNPSTKVVILLMTKAETVVKDELEEAADEMGALFQKFCLQLQSNLLAHKLSDLSNPLTGISYKRVPSHGAGKHSGILGRFTMATKVENCKTV